MTSEAGIVMECRNFGRRAYDLQRLTIDHNKVYLQFLKVYEAMEACSNIYPMKVLSLSMSHSPATLRLSLTFFYFKDHSRVALPHPQQPWS
jgi:hypothetical protein